MHSRRLLARWFALPAVFVLYVVAGKLGLHYAFLHASATPLWPPTGIALAALLLGGYRMWPAIFVGAFVVNVTTAGSAATSLGIAIGNTLEGLVAAWLVRRWANGADAFRFPWSIFAFALAAGFVATAVSATIGVTSLALAGYAPWSGVGPIWLTWWLGDAAGALVVAPFLLVWAEEPHVRDLRLRWKEALAMLVVVGGVAMTVFGGAVSPALHNAPVAFLCLPPIVWAAYRFGPRGATTALVMLSALAASGTLRGYGPFVVGDPNASLLLLQAFLVTLSGTALPLAALSDELARRAASSAENARLYRESEIQRRTAEAFAQTSHALVESLDLPVVANRIVASVRELLGGTTAIVFERDTATGTHTTIAAAGIGASAYDGLRVPAEIGAIGLAARERRPIVSADVTNDPRITLTPEVRARVEQTPMRAVVAVPLVVQGHAIGAFLVGDRAGRVFTSQDTRVAEAFAAYAVLAIRNARLYRQTEDARALAEGASRAKDDFLAVLSHELRTPLTSVAGWMQMLEHGTVTGVQAERAMAAVGRNVTVLRRLIEDLLDVSRIVSGKLILEVGPCDMAAVVEQTVESFNREAETKGVAVTTHLERSLVVEADALRLRQIVSNLVSNALKFTPAGGQILVTLRREGTRAVVTVADTGTGIPPDVLPHIFERFQQADSSTTRHHGGLGLGLAIVKSLVELHGGDVRAENRAVGNGAVLTIELPLAG